MIEAPAVGHVYAHGDGSVWTVVKVAPLTLESLTREHYRRPTRITLEWDYRRILK